MRNSKSLATAVALMLGMGAASAADLPMYAKARPVAVASAYNWTGCYVGGFVGAASGGRVDATEPVNTFGPYNLPGSPYNYDLNNGSFIGGGTLGCNYQSPGSVLVFGVEGELGYINLKSSVIDPNSVATSGGDTIDSTKVGNGYGVIAGRLGVAFAPAWLLYAKGGAAFLRVSSSAVDTCTTAPCGPDVLTTTGGKDITTWALGGGLEYAINSNWSVKGEYLFLGLNDRFSSCGPGSNRGVALPTFCATHTIDGIHTVKFGLNYKFNWSGPVVARF